VLKNSKTKEKVKTINRDIVAAMIISKDKKLLLGMKYAGRGGVYIDSWHIPGGGVEEGENLESALIREIQEEIGLDISGFKIELFDDKGYGESERIYQGQKVLAKMHFYVYKFIVNDKKASEINLHLDDDIERTQWVDFSDLKNIKLTPPSIELFTRKGII